MEKVESRLHATYDEEEMNLKIDQRINTVTSQETRYNKNTEFLSIPNTFLYI